MKTDLDDSARGERNRKTPREASTPGANADHTGRRIWASLNGRSFG